MSGRAAKTRCAFEAFVPPDSQFENSFADLPPRGRMTLDIEIGSPMKDEKTIRERLERLRGQFLQWGTPDLQVFVITKDELRGWIRALEWVLGTISADMRHS